MQDYCKKNNILILEDEDKSTEYKDNLINYIGEDQNKKLCFFKRNTLSSSVEIKVYRQTAVFNTKEDANEFLKKGIFSPSNVMDNIYSVYMLSTQTGFRIVDYAVVKDPDDKYILLAAAADLKEDTF